MAQSAAVYRVAMRPTHSVLAEVSRIPGVSVYVYSVVKAGDKAHTLVRCSLPDSRNAFQKVMETISRRDEVLEYRLIEKRSSSCTLLLTKNMCEFYEYTVAVERHTFFPYMIRKGVRSFYLMTAENPEELRRSLSRYGAVLSLEKMPLENTLEEVGRSILLSSLEGLLTPLQRRVLSEALRRGFFEWPRRVSLEELSRELGVSKVTLSEHLRRGERKLLRYLLDGLST
uniref:HTH bat-type domain-containing protein n=1 Tax=Thermofilum pendens TaxID=2269 RepID=A0A7C3SMH2_THEPE